LEYQTIAFEAKEGVGRISLERPETKNALNLEMRAELIQVFERVRDDDAVKAVVLRGAGGAFCSGGDIRTMEDVAPVAGRTRLKTGHRLIRAMVELEKPLIAAVQGVAAGAGMALALACDLLIAAEDARFSLGFVRIGLVPDWGTLYFLPIRVGMARAKALLMTGDPIDAGEAERMGLVYRVVPPGQVDDEAMDCARRFARGPGQAYAMIKSALNRWPVSLETLLEMEATMQAVAFNSEDFEEGRKAFLEKRKPDFRGA
jgi:2-(1,2-epoxy-1,2-dihydrophenyl)acetyl-CoA isomerase